MSTATGIRVVSFYGGSADRAATTWTHDEIKEALGLRERDHAVRQACRECACPTMRVLCML